MINLRDIVLNEYYLQNDEVIEFLKTNLVTEGKTEHGSYRGRKVVLSVPMKGSESSGDKKEFKMYVLHPKTKEVIKVNFGGNIKKKPIKKKKKKS